MKEKRLKVLRTIIEEEVEKTFLELLNEYEDGDGNYGGYDDASQYGSYDASYGGGYDIGGSSGDGKKGWTPSPFINLLLSPVKDIWAATKHAASRATIQTLGILGFLFSATIAGFLPFSDPRTVNFLSQKIRYWEQENLKKIDKQFEAQLAETRQGWETFKKDFWGIGFIASPLNAIAAITTAEKGINVGLSVLNVVTAGTVSKTLARINADLKDPGQLKDFLEKTKQQNKKEAQDSVEKYIESQMCLDRLNQPGYLNPTCVGLNLRDKFPANQKGTQDFIEFINRNLRDYNEKRKERFEIEYPDKKFVGAFVKKGSWYDYPDKNLLIKWMRENNYISENTETKSNNKNELLEEAILAEIILSNELKDQMLQEGVFDKFVDKLKGNQSRQKTNIPELQALYDKLDAWVSQNQLTKEQANEILEKKTKEILNDPAIKKQTQIWSTKNMANIANGIQQAVIALNANQVRATPEEKSKFRNTDPKQIVKKMIEATKKKFKKFNATPSPETIKVMENVVGNSLKRINLNSQPDNVNPDPQPQQKQALNKTINKVIPTPINPANIPATSSQ